MSTTMEVGAEVTALLNEHEGILELVKRGMEDDGRVRVRVRCALTSHEMYPRKDAIETYLKTKKFLKAKEWYCYDYSKYEPYIVEHRRKPKCLYCNVTNTILNRIPAEVEKHVQGKRYRRLKEHVTFTVKKTKEEEEAEDDEFDANRFEFTNSQVIYSDDEEEEEGNGAVDEEDEEEEEEEDEEEDEAEDDSLSDLYPSEDEEEVAANAALVKQTLEREQQLEKEPENEIETTSNSKKTHKNQNQNQNQKRKTKSTTQKGTKPKRQRRQE